MQTQSKKLTPAKVKARLAMIAFVAVAVGSMMLTSVGLLHYTGIADSANAAIVVNTSALQGLEALR